jgi:hypothetical protein
VFAIVCVTVVVTVAHGLDRIESTHDWTTPVDAWL